MCALAQACLIRCKVPVCLVKAGPRIDTDGMTRLKRVGRDSTPGLNIMVPLDGSVVSELAFDMALKISAKADTICARTSRRRQPLRYHRR